MRARLTIILSAIVFMIAFAAPASAHTPSCGNDTGRAWINAAVRAYQQAKGWGSIGTFTGCEDVGGGRYDVYYSSEALVVLDVRHTPVPDPWVAWNGHWLRGWLG